MEAAELKKRTLAFAREIGPRAYISISVSSGPMNVCGLVYPDGITGNSALMVEADDWSALLDLLHSKWTERAAEYRRKIVRKMALEIIRITAEQGECTDAALRAGEFEASDVATYGADACADANAIASNGPFAITPAAKANAA